MIAGLVGLGAGMMTSVGCDDGGGTTTGKGGAGGRGGSGGNKGGTTGTAGRGGTTGTAGTGTAGTGVAGATAGTTGTAGATAGTTGTGGTGGGTGGALPCPKGTFDTTDEGFALNIYNQSAGNTNLATVEAGTPATRAFTNTDGQPAAGSIKVDAPFTDYNQFFDLQKGYSATTLQNWTGATKLHVRVKVASGGNPSASNPMGIQPYVQTTSGYKDCRKWINAPMDTAWHDHVLDLAVDCTDAAWKISEVIAYGVVLHTGDGKMGDAGVNPMKPTDADIYVDSFYLEGTCPGGTGGTGGGAGGTTGSAGAGGTGGGAAGAAGGRGGTSGTAGTGGTGGVGGATGGVGGVTGGTAGAGGGGGTS